MRLSFFWKALCVVLLSYVLTAGLLLPVPRLPILNETIRLLYFHVPMWFAMIVLFAFSAAYAVRCLHGGAPRRLDDHTLSFVFAKIGFVFGLMGLVTGMIWAKFTWGAAWNNDPKQVASAVSLLIYATYFLLCSAPGKRGHAAAVYNIICFFTMLPLLFILPRFTDSLHPGNGGNPGFNIYDLNSQLRLVFYPAVLGWTLLGVWMASMEARKNRVADRIKEIENSQ